MTVQDNNHVHLQQLITSTMPALVAQWVKQLGYSVDCLCGHQAVEVRSLNPRPSCSLLVYAG